MNTETAQRVLELELPRLRDSELTIDASREAATIQGSHVRFQGRRDGGRKAWWVDADGRLTNNAKVAVLIASGAIAVVAFAATLVIALDTSASRSASPGVNRVPAGAPNTLATTTVGTVRRSRASTDPTRSAGEAAPTSTDSLESAASRQSSARASSAPGERASSAPSAARAIRAGSSLPASGLGEVPAGSPSAVQATKARDADALPASGGVDFTRPIAPLSE